MSFHMMVFSTDRQRDRQSDQTDTNNRHRQTETDRNRHRHTQTDTDRHRQKHRYLGREQVLFLPLFLLRETSHTLSLPYPNLHGITCFTLFCGEFTFFFEVK